MVEEDYLSDYNEAKLQIYRLHRIYDKCNNASQTGDFSKWQNALDNLWRELANDARFTKTKRYQTQIMIIDMKIWKARREKNRTMWYYYLSNKEILLRGLQEDVGKGAKRTQGFERMM